MAGNDFQIIRDEMTGDVRHITAVTSSLVCSSQIDLDLKDGKIYNVKYIRGCDGNLQAIGRLVDGQDALTVAAILDGVNCHGRGTSCSDQLSRIIRTVVK